MKSLTCIVCPIGCPLAVEEGPPGAGNISEFTVSGNRCPRGAVYAREEICAPKRVVTATCGVRGDGPPGREDLDRTAGPAERAGANRDFPRRLPVKTAAPCPREQIPALLADIYQVRAALPVKAGDKIIADWRGSGIDVVAVRSLS
jgi:CxxC motif-containing protein